MLLKPFIITGLALWICSLLLPAISFGSWSALVIAALVLTLIQNLVKPVLQLFFLPITIVTLGVFSSILNLLLLWSVTAIVPGFHIDPMTIWGFSFSQWLSLITVSIALSLTQMLIRRIW